MYYFISSAGDFVWYLEEYTKENFSSGITLSTKNNSAYDWEMRTPYIKEHMQQAVIVYDNYKYW